MKSPILKVSSGSTVHEIHGTPYFYVNGISSVYVLHSLDEHVFATKPSCCVEGYGIRDNFIFFVCNGVVIQFDMTTNKFQAKKHHITTRHGDRYDILSVGGAMLFSDGCMVHKVVWSEDNGYEVSADPIVYTGRPHSVYHHTLTSSNYVDGKRILRNVHGPAFITHVDGHTRMYNCDGVSVGIMVGYVTPKYKLLPAYVDKADCVGMVKRVEKSTARYADRMFAVDKDGVVSVFCRANDTPVWDELYKNTNHTHNLDVAKNATKKRRSEVNKAERALKRARTNLTKAENERDKLLEQIMY